MKETCAECNFSCRPKLPFLTYFKDIKFKGLDSLMVMNTHCLQKTQVQFLAPMLSLGDLSLSF